MGVSLSCPFSIYSDLETGLESCNVKSINFSDDAEKASVRSVSFSSLDTEQTITKSSTDEFERPTSVKDQESEKMDSSKDLSLDQMCKMGRQFSISDSSSETVPDSSVLDPSSPKHEAATKLQKVYKSFRTRRKLADCAVLVEQSWWKLLDFAELKRSSISFFDIEKHETAISRWSRARTRAAKVGKGLSKNDRAQKLALQHWLEAIDPRHRYGHNLHFYYKKWLHCQSREPFFYWLDIGEGKEVNLEKCSRSKLQQQCIKYLGPMERKAYEVVVKNGKFFYKQSADLLNTAAEIKEKWIFVLSTSKNLYVGKKKKGAFQHSSFLAGGVTVAAGRLVVDNVILKAVWPHSGHYRPTEENFRDFLSFLRENNVDLSKVEMSPADEDEESLSKQRNRHHNRNNSSEEDVNEKLIGSEPEDTHVENPLPEDTDSTEQKASAALEPSKLRRFSSFRKKLSHLEIPKTNMLFKRQGSEGQQGFNCLLESPVVNHETAEMSGEEADSEVVIIPKEVVMQRINSHKETKSYQLGRQLSCNWTTGAGPRIGCVRDYPPELQFQALEQVSLSPKSARRSRSCSISRCTSSLSSNILTPTSSQ